MVVLFLLLVVVTTMTTTTAFSFNHCKSITTSSSSPSSLPLSSSWKKRQQLLVLASTPEGEGVAAPAPGAPSAAAPVAPAAAAPTSTSKPSNANKQAQYGKEIDMPASYVRCGKCQTHFAVMEDDLGMGRGRRLECGVCQHSWFQSKDRLMNIRDGFGLVDRPSTELERIQNNIKENREPGYLGEYKLYVGNISFEAVDDDLYSLFGTMGAVGDVSLVKDDIGRNRGFGFVTMMKSADGQKALEELHGVELRGRSIAVRESK